VQLTAKIANFVYKWLSPCKWIFCHTKCIFKRTTIFFCEAVEYTAAIFCKF